MIRAFLNILLDASLGVINHHHNGFGDNLIECCVSNNTEPFPMSFMWHLSPKSDIRQAYTTANPNPVSAKQPDLSTLLHLSGLLQHNTWPLCPNTVQCSKPTVIYQPDVSIMYTEPKDDIPLNCNQFCIPMFVCEIEGAKDVWGEGEQESKAIEEACYGLAFIPHMYILFIYAHHWVLVYFKHNPYTGTIDLEQKRVPIQQDGDIFRDKWYTLCCAIVKILVKQLTSGKRLIELGIPRHRENGCDAPNIYHPPTHVCNHCWSVEHPDYSVDYFYYNPTNIPSLE